VTRTPGDLIGLLARYFRSQGNGEAANALIERSTELDPTDPEPFLAVSGLRGQSGDLEGALAAADKAIAADPKHVKARLRKAELLVDIGARTEDPKKIAEGRAIVDQVLVEDATSPDGLFVLAKVEIANKNIEAGLTALRGALDTRPNWAQAHYVLGSALLLNGDAQRARAELARAVELEPGLLDARRLLVQIHAQLGEHEYAIENGRRYLEARPDDDFTRITVAQSMVRLGKLDDAVALIAVIPEERQTVDTLFAIGRLQAAKGNTAAARATMLKADALRPNNAKILTVLLDIDRSEGKLGNSVKRVNDAVEASPDDAELWKLKGVVALLTGDTTAAEAALEKSIELDPDNLDAYQHLARIYAGTGRTQETITLYEKAVQTQPDNGGANHFLGVLYEMSGQTDKARAQYELALKADSTLGESKNNLAYLMAESGDDLDRALKLAQEAKAAMPDSPNAADTLGWVLYKRGVASAAVGYLREALQVANPDDPGVGEISTHLSLAYEATGEIDKAIETLETALADLERLKQEGRVQSDPPWVGDARTRIEKLKNAG
jgi:tetratricopeptide (TPR) repeat protein